jgi:hypothetical protein
MATVGLGIAPIIEKIDRAPCRTERDDGKKATADLHRIQKFTPEDERGQDDGILQPLPGTRSDYQVTQNQ